MKTTIGSTTVTSLIVTIHCTNYDISAVMPFSDSFIQTMCNMDSVPSKIGHLVASKIGYFQTMCHMDSVPSKIGHFIYNLLPNFSGSGIQVPASNNFYYDKLVEKSSAVITCNNSNTLIMPTAHRSPMDFFNHEYLLYMFLYRIFNHPIMKMLFLAFIAYFMQLVSGIANSRNKSKLAIIMLFFNFIRGANGSDVLSSRKSILLSTIGNLIYLITSAAYDYFCTKNSLRGELVINYKFMNTIVRNIMYSISILSGVYGTNGVWYFSNTIKSKKDLVYLSSIIAPLGSIVCYFGWIKLVTATARQDRDVINSIMRAMLECMGFNLTAFSNYAQWGLWVDNIPYYPQISITLGTALYLILSYLCISLELYETHPLAFAVINYFSFTAAAFSTNAVVEFFSIANVGYLTTILIGVGLSIITTVLAPPLYRGQRFDIRRATRLQRTLYITRYTVAYYALVLSFVLATFISFEYAFPF